jgi:hypothetical protein
MYAEAKEKARRDEVSRDIPKPKTKNRLTAVLNIWYDEWKFRTGSTTRCEIENGDEEEMLCGGAATRLYGSSVSSKRSPALHE